MVVEQNQDNKTNQFNPLIDTGNVTVNAFNAIKNKEKSDANFILGKDDKTVYKSPNFKVKVKAWTQDDDKTHTYFHSLSIDVNVEDFMGTAELKCPYDSDLMEYWEPIRQTVVIYGANRGDYKILFIGRVRGIKQDGYETVIEFQNYGWKFKQLVSQSYAKDNVLNKDGYTIMRLMFEALKIDSYVISESAKNRLKEVGINEDGNVTLNGQEVEKVPDLIDRLKESDPSKLVNKDTLNDKLREKYLHNIKDINYTLKYEEPTPVMKKIASEGSYTSGSNIYKNAYGSASSSGGTGGSSGGGGVDSSNCRNPPQFNVSSSEMKSALKNIWEYEHKCSNDYSYGYNKIRFYASSNPDAYNSQIAPWLSTLAKNGRGGASATKNAADANYNSVKNGNPSAYRSSYGSGASYSSARRDVVGSAISWVSNGVNSAINALKNFFS